ncbi:CDP-diacylglycerol--glycerol-3-phosphate 3-phosphatidyltransferase [soil metagenome]
MNLPNRLTIARLVLTALFVGVMAVDFPLRATVGLLVFAVASITDYLDGAIARKRGLVTTFGKLVDPLADKVLMGAAFVILVDLQLVAAWLVILILAREFLVTGLRLVASAEGAVLAADTLGKQKTILQITAVIYFLVVLASREPGPLAFLAPVFEIRYLSAGVAGTVIMALAALATVVSGLSYLIRNRRLMADA